MDNKNDSEGVQNRGSSKFGVALFGAGRIGKVHFQNLYVNPRVRLLYVVEQDVSRAQALVEQYGVQEQVQVVCIEEAQRVFEDPRVSVTMICTPSFIHQELVEKSFQAGNAVFCEKPLAPTIAAVKACYDLAAKKHQPLFCAFNRRYDPQCRRLYNLVKSGSIGKVRVLKTCSRDTPAMTPKEYLLTSGGIFVDSMVHDFDLLCWIVGEKPLSLYATGSAMNPMFSECNDVDSAAVTLNFPGGAIGFVEVSRDARVGYDQRIEVLGSEGMLQTNNRRETDVTRWTLTGSQGDVIYDDCCQRYHDSYRRELEHFLNVLQHKEEIEVTAESTLAVNFIAQACKESLQRGQAVRLNYDI